MTTRSHIDEVVSWLKARGASEIGLEHHSKHPKILFTWREKQQFYVIAWTPGDRRRCVDQAISNLRHQMGIVQRVKRVGERRVRRSRAPLIQVHLPTLSVGGDGMQAILHHPVAHGHLPEILDLAWKDWWRARMRAAGMESRL